mgnify:CR=1 FL=1
MIFEKNLKTENSWSFSLRLAPYNAYIQSSDFLQINQNTE